MASFQWRLLCCVTRILSYINSINIIHSLRVQPWRQRTVLRSQITSVQMSSYFVNSLSTCYGQTVGLESCSEGGFHRNGNYQHAGAIYPGFPGARYPYSSKEERVDEQNGDFYGAPRLSHLPHSSPCSSPHSLHGGNHNSQNVHHIHSSERSSCNIRTNSNSSSYYPNGQISGGVERSRTTPPSQQPPPTPPDQSQQQGPVTGQTGTQNQAPHSPRPSDQSFPPPQIYPWMRRMQYSQGKGSMLLNIWLIEAFIDIVG